MNRPLFRRVAFVASYVAVTWFFGGRNGLIAGAVISAAWWAGLPRQLLWAASVVLLAAAPIALMAQGLPPASAVDPTFATSHLLAHVLVGLAMATAGFAALREILEPGTAAEHPSKTLPQTPPSKARPAGTKSRNRSKRRG